MAYFSSSLSYNGGMPAELDEATPLRHRKE